MTDAQKCADLAFLALTVWREARGESSVAKLAVAYSILDRVTHPTWWGRDVQSVVFKRWQYSSLTAPNDPQLVTWPLDSSDLAWIDCLLQATAALANTSPNPAPMADSYFDESIAPPAWAQPKMFVRQIGRLKFYNLNRDHEAEAMK